MIAAGFGCRAGCPARDVLAALEHALAAAGRSLAEISAFYTAQSKGAEPGLLHAAELASKPLLALPLERLQAQNGGALSRSAHALQRFGVPSLAETAALAGACADARGAPSSPRLLGPRSVAGSATCALAVEAPELAEVAS